MVDLDKYCYFQIDYRINSWHLIGRYFSKEFNCWFSDELSNDMCFITDLADFIKKANIYYKGKNVKNRFAHYHNFHYSESFNSELMKLLKLIEEE